jgi:hypothetical protein
MMASNEDWVIPASADERRFAMFDVSSMRRNDHAYFDALTAQIDEAGLAAMLHDLLRMDLGRWHPRLNIPKTEALRVQVQHSEDPMRSLFRELLFLGQLPGLQAGRNLPNELLSPAVRKLLKQRPYGHNYSEVKQAVFLKSIPGVKRDNNGWFLESINIDTGQPELRRCIRYELPRLKDLREWFDPREDWDGQEDWDFPQDESVPL